MSYGLVICTVCQREVHQGRESDERLYWYHCDTKSRICLGGFPKYPDNREEIKGEWCGSDDLDGRFRRDDPMSRTCHSCGEQFSLHTATVCPKCFTWPNKPSRLMDRLDKSKNRKEASNGNTR